ncbi:unnamed protein product [Porites evermanni]|uniref:DUF4062 domain-containing protein n=1 Tax=Porites evermanni TaxID=104178 RepID=A0ABN8PG66_9CNID|nr:unnamed protein product [Porites evermanni]
MGTGASKKPKVENKQLKPARSKLMAAVALAKPGAVPAPGMQKKTTIETLWKEPRHERGKWKELLEKNLVDFEPVPLDKNMVNTLLRGKTLQTKASDIRIIRVFISSTFTDTAQERNLLIADVYPYLKLFGRKYGFEFASSEMRWGIREESSSDHMTSIICMAEIARCQRESQGINYVAFLGDKYGFRPFPSRIEASEFEQLQAQAEKDNDPDVNLLSEWFDLNTNLVPHTYILKPSSQAQHGKWWDIFEKLQMTLRKASRCLKDKERAKWYTVSVTEEEVHRGLLNMNNRDQKTFCYRRKIINLDNNYQDKPAGKFIDKKYSDGTIDSEAQRFLHKLKDEKVPGALNPSNIKNYTVNWGPGITLEQHADYLRLVWILWCDKLNEIYTAPGKHYYKLFFLALASLACSQSRERQIRRKKKQIQRHKKCLWIGCILTSVKRLWQQTLVGMAKTAKGGPPQYKQCISPRCCQSDESVSYYQSSCCKQFGDHFCDLMVQSMTEAIKGGHVADDVLFEEVKSHAVFCLEKAAQVYGKDDILEKSSDAVIIYRFLGTSMDSTAARPLLRSLCIQLRRIYSKDPNGVANDFKTLCEEFIQNLKLATNGQPLFLFLDSLDQMTDEDNGRNLEWLPFELPSRNVKIVVSTLPEEGGCLNKLRLSLPEEGLVEVTKMSANDGKELLESWLKASNRSLTASQMLEVLDAFNECPYPLFLKIAFETSCTWTSSTPVDDITLSRTVRQLIDDMFDRLIRIHGNLLVDHALGYLTVAKFGLTANELEDILSCDDEVLNDVYQWWEPPVRRLPPLLWVRIQTDLGPYLVERGLKGGTPVLSWYHRQFREAAEERFVSDPEVRKKRHGAIAEYFIGRWAGQPLPYVGKDGLSKTADRKVASQPLVLNQTSSSDTSSKTRQYNMRKLTELPTALIGAERWQLFLESVCCIPFIEAKCNIGLVYELINEIKQASSLARSRGNQQAALSFKEFAQMLSENVQVLDQYPECTLQQSANFPDSSAPAKAAQVKSMTNTSKEFKNSEVVHMDFSPDGKYLAAGYENRHIVIWDVENCEVVHSLVNEDSSSKCHESKITSLRYTPNGRYLWSVEEKGIHKTWDAQSNYQCLAKGTCLAKWYDDDEGDKLEGEIPGGIFTGHYEMEFPEGNSGDASFPIRFWDDGTLSGEGSDKDGDYTIKGTYDLASGTMKLVQEQYIASAEYDLQFEFTPNTEAADGTWKIQKKKEISTEPGVIAALEFSHDGSKLAAVIDNCDYVQFYTSRDNCCFSPDDSQLLVSKGRNLVVFNVENGKEVDRFKNIYGYETGRACFSPQGQLAVQGLDQRYARSKIKIFTYPDKQLVQQFDDLSDNNTFIPCVFFSKDGFKLYSVGSEKQNNFIVVLCMKTGSVLQTIKPPTGFGRFCLDVSGTKCIIGSWDGNVSVFELETGKNLLEIKPQSWRINGISSFQIDGHDFVVSGCEDRSFKILDMKTGMSFLSQFL